VRSLSWTKKVGAGPPLMIGPVGTGVVPQARMRLSPCRRRRILASLAWNCSCGVCGPPRAPFWSPESCPPSSYAQIPVPAPPSPPLVTCQMHKWSVRVRTDTVWYGYVSIRYPSGFLARFLSTRGLDDLSGPHSPLLFGSSYDGGLEMLFK
jgi:hypothetical protein